MERNYKVGDIVEITGNTWHRTQDKGKAFLLIKANNIEDVYDGIVDGRNVSCRNSDFKPGSEELVAKYHEEVKKQEEVVKINLEVLKQAVKRVYPEHSEVKKVNHQYKVIVHFPEVQTINTNNKTWNHKDIFIILKFNQNLNFTDMYGVRSTYTYLESIKQYKHPHISSGFDLSEHSCCVGTGPLAHLTDELRIKFDENIFEATLYSIQDWIKWESLEGGPYYKTSELVHSGTTSANDPGDAVKKQLYEEFISKCPEFITVLNQKEDLVSISVNNNENFENLVNMYTSTNKCFKQGTYYYTDRNVTSGTLEEIAKLNASNANKVFKFNNTDFPLLIIPDEVQEKKTVHKEYPNPYVTKYIQETLQADINKYYLYEKQEKETKKEEYATSNDI